MSSIGPMCERERHQICGGHHCTCDCHPGTPEEREKAADAAVADFLGELVEVTESTGRHEGHSLSQVGRCVYCTCGFRYQGRTPAPGNSATFGRNLDPPF